MSEEKKESGAAAASSGGASSGASGAKKGERKSAGGVSATSASTGGVSATAASAGGVKKGLFVAATVILVAVAIGWTMFGQNGEGETSSDNTSEVSGNGSINKNAKIEDVATDGEKVNMYLFWGSTCPHCKAEYEYLEGLGEEEKAKFRLYGFEVWGSDENADLLQKVAGALGQEAKGVPYLVIEDEVVSGYLDESTGEKIMEIVNEKFGKKDREDVFIREILQK